MTNRNVYILVFLIACTILPSLHHLIDTWPAIDIDLFIFCDKKQDLQWYVKDTFDMSVKALLCFSIARASTVKIIREIAWFLFAFTIVDIAGYWMYYGQYTYYTMSLLFLIFGIYKLLKHIIK